MPPELDNTDVNLLADIEDGTLDTQPGTGQVNELDKPENTDVRSLLESAVKADANGNLHGPGGKFAAKPKEGDELAANGEGTENTDQQQPGTDTANTAVSQQFALAPEYEQLVSTLPEASRNAVRDTLVERERAIATYVQGLAGQVTGYAGIEQHLSPRRQAWQMQGVTPEAAVGQLFALSDFATRDPMGFINWFAGNNNIDLSEAGEAFVPPNPEFQALEARIGEIANTVNGLAQAGTQQQQGQFMTAIDTFGATVDTNNQPKYPHFNTVMNDMVSLVPSIRQQQPHLNTIQLLEAAYDRAVYANPTTRQQVIDAQAAKLLKDRVEQARKAKNAGQSIPGGSAGDGNIPATTIKNDTVRAALEGAIAFHS